MVGTEEGMRAELGSKDRNRVVDGEGLEREREEQPEARQN